MTKQIITNQLAYIDTEIANISKLIKTLPQGKLSFYQYGKYIRWVQIYNNKKITISKKKREFAHKLLYQEYLSSKLSDLYFEKSQLKTCLETIASYNSNEITFWNKKLINTFLNPSTFLHKYINTELSEYSSAFSQFDDSWNNLPYIKNTQYPEQLLYPSISGNKLRSKSEVIIDQALYFNKVDYRYECQLCLEGINVYPDFMAISLSSKQLIIWEHLGMMDEPHYINCAINKIKLYIRNGYVPGINLILTSETNLTPLNPLLVNDLIKHFLL